MRAGYWIAALLLAALTACGGSVSVGVGVESRGLRLILWTGNVNGDLVLDADNEHFAFYSDNGCLYNYQTGRRNTSFCLTDEGDLIDYQGFLIRIVNIRSTAGTCVAALVEHASLRFIDIQLDASGRETVFVTRTEPALCIV